MFEMRESGSSFRDIIVNLNDARGPLKRGGRWHPQTVARAITSTDGYQVVCD
jgi:glutamate dehydrogenase/leucine dehydrogenase